MTAAKAGTRRAIKDFLDSLMIAEPAQLRELLASHVMEDAVWHIAHPVNQADGIEAIATSFVEPLRQSFGRLIRRDDIFMSGTSRTGSGEWVASLGHYVGTFRQPLFGIAANDRLVFLRSGEFYRIEQGKIVEARILFDLVDLMRQTGAMPLPLAAGEELGAEILFPAPATHDGILLETGDPAHADRSAALVEAMLGDLRVFDPATFDSAGQSGEGGYWHRDMLWYGPCGIGSNFTYGGFLKDHRIPFLKGFPDRVGGNHYARFGDGDYVASGGWPSLTATHAGDYLGMPATNRKIGMRVMDFWRCMNDPQTGHQIAENWVLIDMIDLFRQFGHDLLPAS